MFKKNIVGKYIPGDSVLHKLDARTKIIISLVMTFLIFFVKNPILPMLIFLICLLMVKISNVSILKFIKSNRFIIIFSLVTTLINLFFQGQSNFLTSGVFFVSLKSINFSMSFIIISIYCPIPYSNRA